jgi:hypothetical protein
VRLKEAVAELNRLRADYGFDATMHLDDLEAFARRNRGRADDMMNALARSSASRDNERASRPACPSGR